MRVYSTEYHAVLGSKGVGSSQRDSSNISWRALLVHTVPLHEYVLISRQSIRDGSQHDAGNGASRWSDVAF